MKKTIINIMALLSIMVMLFAISGCPSDVEMPPPSDENGDIGIMPPGAEPSSLIPITNGAQDIGKATKQWDDLFLNGYMYTTNGTARLTLPDVAGKIVTDNGTFSFSGTITINDLVSGNVTITGGAISGATISVVSPTITGTTTIDDFVADNVSITGGAISGATISVTSPTITGTTTIDDLVSGNATITGGAISGATISVASPTITGTPSNANVAMGTDNVSSGYASATFAHGMSGTPTIVLVSWAGDTGDDYYIFWNSADATNITVATSSNITSNTMFSWVAWVNSE